MDATHRAIRERALKVYYENPSICKECQSVICVKDNQQPGEARKKKFCNRSCAASFNNRKYPKRLRDERTICRCGNKKDFHAKLCHDCMCVERLAQAEKKPIKEFFNEGNARIKYSAIRTWARTAMRIWGVEKCCAICGFSIVIEIHHWERISDCSEDSLLGEVNSRENMDYLCPNDHAMAERGLLTKPDKKIRSTRASVAQLD